MKECLEIETGTILPFFLFDTKVRRMEMFNMQRALCDTEQMTIGRINIVNDY